MKEQIHTIPVNDAFLSEDECPFCFLERQVERSAINYTVGPEASYMESEVRGLTDEQGFCGHHLKMLFDYGNSLGSALILQTYFKSLNRELGEQIASFNAPPKKALFGRKKAADDTTPPLLQWAAKRQSTCYVCGKMEYNMQRYYETFFALIREAEFRSRVEACKGFCLRHFAELIASAEENLPNSEREWFYPTVFSLMQDNMARVKEDLDWFIGMFDYRQQGADWKNSRDALSRTMQKLRGLHPADPPYKQK